MGASDLESHVCNWRQDRSGSVRGVVEELCSTLFQCNDVLLILGEEYALIRVVLRLNEVQRVPCCRVFNGGLHDLPGLRHHENPPVKVSAAAYRVSRVIWVCYLRHRVSVRRSLRVGRGSITVLQHGPCRINLVAAGGYLHASGYGSRCG